MALRIEIIRNQILDAPLDREIAADLPVVHEEEAPVPERVAVLPRDAAPGGGAEIAQALEREVAERCAGQAAGGKAPPSTVPLGCCQECIPAWRRASLRRMCLCASNSRTQVARLPALHRGKEVSS